MATSLNVLVLLVTICAKYAAAEWSNQLRRPWLSEDFDKGEYQFRASRALVQQHGRHNVLTSSELGDLIPQSEGLYKIKSHGGKWGSTLSRDKGRKAGEDLIQGKVRGRWMSPLNKGHQRGRDFRLFSPLPAVGHQRGRDIRISSPTENYHKARDFKSGRRPTGVFLRPQSRITQHHHSGDSGKRNCKGGGKARKCKRVHYNKSHYYHDKKEESEEKDETFEDDGSDYLESKDYDANHSGRTSSHSKQGRKTDEEIAVDEDSEAAVKEDQLPKPAPDDAEDDGPEYGITPPDREAESPDNTEEPDDGETTTEYVTTEHMQEESTDPPLTDPEDGAATIGSDEKVAAEAPGDESTAAEGTEDEITTEASDDESTAAEGTEAPEDESAAAEGTEDEITTEAPEDESTGAEGTEDEITTEAPEDESTAVEGTEDEITTEAPDDESTAAEGTEDEITTEALEDGAVTEGNDENSTDNPETESTTEVKET